MIDPEAITPTMSLTAIREKALAGEEVKTALTANVIPDGTKRTPGSLPKRCYVSFCRNGRLERLFVVVRASTPPEHKAHRIMQAVRSINARPVHDLLYFDFATSAV